MVLEEILAPHTLRIEGMESWFLRHLGNTVSLQQKTEVS
jgi:hypothetical protein